MKDLMKTILLSDLDGTLFNTKGEVSQQNKKAINDFISRGGMFGIATGRSQINSLAYLENININAPSILYNGCALYDFKTDQFILLHKLRKDNLTDYLMFCIKEFPKVMIQIYSEKMCYIVTPEETADPEVLLSHMPHEFRELDDLMEVPWIKILFSGEKKDLELIRDKINEFHLNEEIAWVFSSDIYLEFLPPDTNKGSMLEELRTYLGEGYEIYAVGDYNNDREMLIAADVGIAPDNAIEKIKEIADILTVSNDEHAIADIIYRLVLKQNKSDCME